MNKNKSKKRNHLRLVRPSEAETEKRADNPDVSQSHPLVANPADQFARKPDHAEERAWWRAAVLEFTTPMEETRLRLAAIDDIEELAQEFNDGELWVYGALHDELRRARSGAGYYSSIVAQRSDAVFMMGYALSSAYQGDGPLSTPIENFRGDSGTWGEETIKLNEQLRPDAIELRCCLSFMMH